MEYETFDDRIEIVDGLNRHVISMEAIGSWSELLGINDPGETLDAIRFVAENGQPEPDPVTSENAWTPAYEALQIREQARAKEWFTAEHEGTTDDPRSPRLRAAFAAHPIDDQVAAGRDATRAMLGLPPLGMSQQPRVARTLTSDEDPLAGLKAELRTNKSDTISHARESFLAELRPQLPTDQETDPH